MNLFKITDLREFPKDEKDHPLDERDMPLGFEYQADLDLDSQFGLSDGEYDAIDNISPVIDQQMQDMPEDPENGQFQDELDDGELDMPLDGTDGMDPDEMDMDLSAEGEEEPQEDDPNMQGIIRTVKGANLVYKRQMPDNTFTELWIMNVGRDMKKESQTKRAILAGTDVDAQSQQSTDGKQNMELYTVGNVQFCELSGLPQ
jgi:hypothetical protein